MSTSSSILAELDALRQLARRGGALEAYAQLEVRIEANLKDVPEALVLFGQLATTTRRCEVAIRTLDRVPAFGDDVQTAWSLVHRSEACNALGRLREAVEDAREAVRLARASGDVPLSIAACLTTVVVAQRFSANEAAVGFYDEARALALSAERVHDVAKMAVVGYPPLIAVGRIDDAIAQLRAAWDYAQEQGQHALAQRVGNALALILGRSGELGMALKLLGEVRAVAGDLNGLARLEWLQIRVGIDQIRGLPPGPLVRTLRGLLPSPLLRAFLDATWALVGADPLTAGPHIDRMEAAQTPGYIAAEQGATVLRAIWCAHRGEWARIETLLSRPSLGRVSAEIGLEFLLDRLAGLALDAGREDVYVHALSLARPFYAQYGHPRAVEILGDLEAHRGAFPLGAFSIGSKLGEGAAGVVFEGVHRLSGLPIVLKALRAETGQHRAMVKLFETEIRRMAGLEHPGTLPALEHGVVQPCLAAARGVQAGLPYLVLPRVDGDLTTLQGALAWPDVREILLMVLDSLAAAHARQVVHFDIKPANLLYRTTDQGLQVWLADFGLATSYAEMRSRRAGTPDFMAPEQWSGKAVEMGPWTDLYALGCTAFQLVSGEPPFTGESLAVLERAHRYAPRPSVEGRADVPVGFDDWLRRMTDVDPLERFARAHDAASALRKLDQAPLPVPRPEIPRSVVDAGLSLVAHRRSPTFGREQERERLRVALRQAERAPVCIDLVGQPGEGATHLARWVGERRHEIGGQFWDLRMGALGPTRAVQDALIRWVFEPVREPGEAVRRASELGLPCPERLVALAAGHVPLDEVLPTFWEVVESAARWRPLVVLLDDFTGAVELPDAPVLVVRTRRGRRGEGLGRLEDESLAQSLRALAPVSSETASTLARLARGNPGHAQQLLLLAIEQRLLTPTSSGYLLASQWHGALPSTYGTTLMERLRHLVGGTNLPLLAQVARLGRGASVGEWHHRFLDSTALPALEQAGLVEKVRGLTLWSHRELHQQLCALDDG